MPRYDNAQRQFLLGSSFKGKQKNGAKSRRSAGTVRNKGSVQSETLSPPQTPNQPKIRIKPYLGIFVKKYFHNYLPPIPNSCRMLYF